MTLWAVLFTVETGVFLTLVRQVPNRNLRIALVVIVLTLIVSILTSVAARL